MEKILLVTQTMGYKSACGIGLIGKLLGESLEKSKDYDIETVYADSDYDVEIKIKETNPSMIIYNYHSHTTSWINHSPLRHHYDHIKHVMIHHDFHQTLIDTYHPDSNHGFKYLISPDPTLKGNEFVYIVNRLIPPYEPLEYVENGIPKIGFQGFGFKHKGIHKIAEKVNEEFDEAILRLHIPYSHYGDISGVEAQNRVNEVKSIITKPGIKIEVSHDLISTKEIVEYLSQNTINCYFYDYLNGAGLASSPDYGLAARRPIAVTNSHQLRHFQNLSPSICIDDNSLKDIISFGLDPLNEMLNNYSEENVIRNYEEVIKQILQK